MTHVLFPLTFLCKYFIAIPIFRICEEDTKVIYVAGIELAVCQLPHDLFNILDVIRDRDDVFTTSW